MVSVGKRSIDNVWFQTMEQPRDQLKQCSGLLTLVRKQHRDLASALNRDFMKFLDRAFRLRYASNSKVRVSQRSHN